MSGGATRDRSDLHAALVSARARCHESTCDSVQAIRTRRRGPPICRRRRRRGAPRQRPRASARSTRRRPSSSGTRVPDPACRAGIPSTAASRRTPAAGPPRRRSGPSSTRRSPGGAISGTPPRSCRSSSSQPRSTGASRSSRRLLPPNFKKREKGTSSGETHRLRTHFPSERLNSAAIFNRHEKRRRPASTPFNRTHFLSYNPV